MNPPIYPPAPARVDPNLLKPSAAFKKQVAAVVLAIIAFFVVYILLVIGALALAVGCFYLGGWIVISIPKIITILIALGMIALGISIVFFLIKFIFAVTKDENPQRIEIKREDHLQLFHFIEQLSKETGTPLPKKIFVSPQVNAAVFYNSSFWSMFFPVRKNLEIGLGLVNCVNASEFKAVVAHEFGHFSQRSMKLGSFTYNVNQVIFNMLYNNKSYVGFLNAWGSIHGAMAVFASITAGIANGIQWILRGMYMVINKQYLSLSREMEFHADAVAASVAGGNNLISALSRIEFADTCYRSALDNAEALVKENKQVKNIFKNQFFAYQSLGKHYQLPIENGFPQVSFQFIQSLSHSRVNFKNQWASHPLLEERKLNVEKLHADVNADPASAWCLFNHAVKLQETVTENLYTRIKTENQLSDVDEEAFELEYVDSLEANKYPAVYKNFYDNRFVDVKAWDFDQLKVETVMENMDSIFTDDNAKLQAAIQSMLNDKSIVTAIMEKQIDTKTFDFDGEKYLAKDAEQVIEQLQNEIDAAEIKLTTLDKHAFVFFYNQLDIAGQQELVEGYKSYKVAYDRQTAFRDLSTKIFDRIRPFYMGNNTVESVQSILSTFKQEEECEFKIVLRKLLELPGDHLISPILKERIEKFIHSNYAYFAGGFMDNELEHLTGLVTDIGSVLQKDKQKRYKSMLTKQEALYGQALSKQAYA